MTLYDLTLLFLAGLWGYAFGRTKGRPLARKALLIVLGAFVTAVVWANQHAGGLMKDFLDLYGGYAATYLE